MNLVSFRISLVEVSKLLTDIGFFRMKGIKSINDDGVSAEFKNVCQQLDYLKIYKVAVQNFDFDLLLFDESFFQFSLTVINDLVEVRYAFFQNPITYKSYEEYIEILREDGIISDETDEEIGDAFFEDYQQFISEQQINVASTTIRYDVDYNNYKPLVHSLSHIHIGNYNHIRIPCNKFITPLKFVLFILKHVYYKQWKNFIEGENAIISKALLEAKEKCSTIEEVYWTDLEKLEMFLS